MRISYPTLAVALLGGVSAAHAQAVETVIAPQPAAVVAAPVETVETVRTVQSTTTPRRHFVHRDRVTTTRTTVTERVVPTTPAVVAITQPRYIETQPRYTEGAQVPPRLYDVVTPAPIAGPIDAPFSSVTTQNVLPTYRYVYEPNRILVIDPYTNIAVQAIPR